MPAARLARRPAAVIAAVGLAALALTMPAGPAVAGVQDCASAVSDDGTSYQLNSDCLTTNTIVVPDGYTFDGNGFTIMVRGTFSGPVISSTSGTVFGEAQLSVTDLHIVADLVTGPPQTSDLSGIAFRNAFGSVNSTTIDGISRRGTGNEGFGILVRRDTGGGGGNIEIRGVAITNFQRAGIRLDGVSGTFLDGVTIGASNAPRANPHGIEASGGAEGDVASSTIGLNHSTSAAHGAHASGVLLSDAGPWFLNQVLFKGADGDVGIESHRSVAPNTPVRVSCARFARTSSAAGDGRYGVGILKTGMKNQDTEMYDTAFSGWNRDTAFAADASSPSYTGSGMSMGHLPGCPMTSPAGVRASGGDGSTKVTWKPSSVTKYSTLYGYTVRVSRPGSSKSVSVGPEATSAKLAGLRNGRTYKVTVTAKSSAATKSARSTLYPTRLSLSSSRDRVRRGGSSVLSGVLTTPAPDGKTSGRRLAVLARPVGGSFHRVATVTTHADGSYRKAVSAVRTTTYRVTYAGRPYLASTSPAVTVTVA